MSPSPRSPFIAAVFAGSLFTGAVLTGCEAEPQRPPFADVARQQWEKQVEAARFQVDRRSELKSLEEALADKNLEISRLQSEVDGLRDELAVLKARDTRSLGSIHEIDGEGQIWINAGSLDGVQERQVLDVWSSGDADAPEVRKGQVQVVRVMGDHLAQAKPFVDKTGDKSSKSLTGSAPPLAVGDKLRRSISKPAGVQFAPTKTPVQVGQVLKYESNLELVTISLGSDQGIVKGQRLFVYRASPARFLCEVRVLVVAPDRCSAQHVDGLNATPVSLVVGDQAATSMPLGLDRPAASDVLDKEPAARKTPGARGPSR